MKNKSKKRKKEKTKIKKEAGKPKKEKQEKRNNKREKEKQKRRNKFAGPCAQGVLDQSKSIDRYMLFNQSLIRGRPRAHVDVQIVPWCLPGLPGASLVPPWCLPGASLVPPWCLLAPLDLVPGSFLELLCAPCPPHKPKMSR